MEPTGGHAFQVVIHVFVFGVGAIIVVASLRLWSAEVRASSCTSRRRHTVARALVSVSKLLNGWNPDFSFYWVSPATPGGHLIHEANFLTRKGATRTVRPCRDHVLKLQLLFPLLAGQYFFSWD